MAIRFELDCNPPGTLWLRVLGEDEEDSKTINELRRLLELFGFKSSGFKVGVRRAGEHSNMVSIGIAHLNKLPDSVVSELAKV